MPNNMEVICRLKRFSAMEYIKFLKFYDVECFGFGIVHGENMAVYANEDKYLEVSFTNPTFNSCEKQLISTLELVEDLAIELRKLQGILKKYDEPTEE